MDMKLEVVVVPVSDVDKAKDFYHALGWRLDADFAKSEDFRVVQLVRPGGHYPPAGPVRSMPTTYDSAGCGAST
jgi:catechol 2,3-dioxygenase-like lactoylglutathione lyase family enzyme